MPFFNTNINFIAAHCRRRQRLKQRYFGRISSKANWAIWAVPWQSKPTTLLCPRFKSRSASFSTTLHENEAVRHGG